MKDRKGQEVCTTDGRPGEEADISILTDGPRKGQQRDYRVLCEGERAIGYVRPFRDAYKHLACGKITTMGKALAETYARDPSFYGATFCSTCCAHFPVGEDGEFVWYEMDGSIGPKVGT
jgi:hypothetical protein